jgi:replicative DNA helicase
MNVTKTKNGKLAIDLNYGKIPPQNVEIEESILGVCMLEGHAFATANQFIFEQVFYKDAHQRIFQAFCKLFDSNKPIDMMTVVQQLRENSDLELVGGAYAITKLVQYVSSSAHLEDWCKILLELYMKREGIRIAADLQVDCFSDDTDSFEVFNKADNDIINLQERVLSGQIANIGSFSRKVYEQYETVKLTGVLGIRSGIEPIDRVMSGLVSPDLIILAARPSQGKTALALSITKNVTYDQKIEGAWFSLEMGGDQLVRRMTSMVTGIDHEAIRKGTIAPHLETAFYKALDDISTLPLYIEDRPNLNIRDLRTRAIVLKRKHNIKYIIVDYIQLMSGVDTKNKNRNDIVGEISRGLKMLCKELDIPIIALSQLNRAVESRADKIPNLGDLRESGAIEQDADAVLFLMRPEFYGLMNEYSIEGKEYAPQGLCLGIIGKNRHGVTKNIAMEWVGNKMTIQTHTSGLSLLPYEQQNNSPKNISLPYNNQQPRNVSADDSWLTMDENKLF